MDFLIDLKTFSNEFVCQEFSARLQFSDVTKWFEKIYNAKTNNEKASLFQRFIGKVRDLQAKFIDEEGPNVVSN